MPRNPEVERYAGRYVVVVEGSIPTANDGTSKRLRRATHCFTASSSIRLNSSYTASKTMMRLPAAHR